MSLPFLKLALTIEFFSSSKRIRNLYQPFQVKKNTEILVSIFQQKVPEAPMYEHTKLNLKIHNNSKTSLEIIE